MRLLQRQSKPSANTESTKGAVTLTLLFAGVGSVVAELTEAVNGTGLGAL